MNNKIFFSFLKYRRNLTRSNQIQNNDILKHRMRNPIGQRKGLFNNFFQARRRNTQKKIHKILMTRRHLNETLDKQRNITSVYEHTLVDEF